jgi:hypothetical protein
MSSLESGSISVTYRQGSLLLSWVIVEYPLSASTASVPLQQHPPAGLLLVVSSQAAGKLGSQALHGYNQHGHYDADTITGPAHPLHAV